MSVTQCKICKKWNDTSCVPRNICKCEDGLIKEKEVVFVSDWGKINMQKIKDEIEWIKPEDAPLHLSIKH